MIDDNFWKSLENIGAYFAMIASIDFRASFATCKTNLFCFSTFLLLYRRFDITRSESEKDKPSHNQLHTGESF